MLTTLRPHGDTIRNRDVAVPVGMVVFACGSIPNTSLQEPRSTYLPQDPGLFYEVVELRSLGGSAGLTYRGRGVLRPPLPMKVPGQRDPDDPAASRRQDDIGDMAGRCLRF
jgi:hypothetical protein